MNEAEVTALRAALYRQLEPGRGAAEIAAALGGSRRAVYQVAEQLRTIGEAAMHDFRVNNAGRPRLHEEGIGEIVRRVRQTNPTIGPRVLHALMQRHPVAYGVGVNDTPSPAYLGRAIQRLGLAVKPAGPRDQRLLPDSRPTGPGTITVDTWGPWQIGSTKLFLATVQDRFTRFSAAIPGGRLLYGDPAGGGRIGFDTATWSLAIAAAQTYLAPGGIRRVYADNGIGRIPVFRPLPFAARYAPSLGAALVSIPPAQPWRNGRLERVHGTMEREVWRPERPSRLEDAASAPVAWLDYYNRDRPPSAVDYKSPLEAAGHGPDGPEGYRRTMKPPKLANPVRGRVECLRVAHHDGTAEVWAHRLPVAPALAGQYLRVAFDVTGARSDGYVAYQQMQGAGIIVTGFAHNLDAIGATGPGRALFTASRPTAFPSIALPNQRLDEEQRSNQQSRVAKRAMGRDRADA